MLIKHSESYRNEAIPQALSDAMGEFVGEGFKSGKLKDTAGLKPTAEGFRLRSSRNRITVTDGPFTETKEVLGGYALVEVASKEEAMKMARQFMELHRLHWPAFECECEVRPLEDSSRSKQLHDPIPRERKRTRDLLSRFPKPVE